MQQQKACSFFGHSEIEINDDLKNRLSTTIEKLIADGYGYFYFGGFGMFDDLCWQIVTKLKDKYPFIKRIYCLFDPRHLRKSKRPKWLKDEDYEEFVYLDLDFDWWYKRIYFRNCAIIDRSDCVIFYVNHTQNSGAYKAMKYAKGKKAYINLGELENKNS